MPATLSPVAFPLTPSPAASATRAAAVDDVGRFLALGRKWVDANADVVAKCYLVLAAGGFEVYPVAVADPLGPVPSDRLAALLVTLADAGLPADGFVVPDGPPTSLAAHFDPHRAIVVTPRAAP